MAIDGIGRPTLGNLPPTMEGTEAAPAEAAASSAGKLDNTTLESPELSALQRGELSVEEYLDQQVQSAAQHLEARLPPEQLAFVKESLRASLETDPVLMELVRRVTNGITAEMK